VAVFYFQLVLVLFTFSPKVLELGLHFLQKAIYNFIQTQFYLAP
jgi:hypothetical protein